MQHCGFFVRRCLTGVPLRLILDAGACLLVAAVVLTGCRQAQVKTRLKEYSAALDPKLGEASKADVIRELGMPERCETANGHEFCSFRVSYGHVGQAAAYGSTMSASSYERYDQVVAEFDETGTFLSWRAHVER